MHADGGGDLQHPTEHGVLIQIGAMVGPENEGFWPVMWTRVIKNAVQFPVNGLILFGIWKALKRIPAQLRTF